MADIETLGILEEIEALVSDKLQVVSYKWLSRNFLVTSNVAKRLLHEFVEKHGGGLEVVYTLSGWLKNDPPVYHIRLVSEPKLAEAKQEFDGHCSVQVYSVQACIPKDPAALWNAEFVQAEELFKQPFAVDNCLRDNRFCGISNSFVKRTAEGAPVSNVASQPKTTGLLGPSKSISAHQTIAVQQPQERKVQQSSPKVSLQSPSVVTDVKDESNGTRAHDQASKPPADKGKAPPLPANKKKGQNDKSSGTEGSLANMWGRASVKSKPSCAPGDAVSAEAQICAREAVEGASSDEDGQDANFKRASNGDGGRKRRVVFDFSDEEEEFEDAVNLASPDPPKGKSCIVSKQSPKPLVPDKINLISDQQKQDKPKVKEEKSSNRESNLSPREDSSVLSKGKNNGISSSDKIAGGVPEIDVNKKDKVTDAAPNSPKRRKVMKTRIDERGREVTEVVWEGEAETKKADSNETKKSENSIVTNVANRPPPAKKSPAVGNTAPSNATGKAGSKKAGNSKDPKQGNIMSFFKRV